MLGQRLLDFILVVLMFAALVGGSIFFDQPAADACPPGSTPETIGSVIILGCR